MSCDPNLVAGLLSKLILSIYPRNTSPLLRLPSWKKHWHTDRALSPSYTPPVSLHHLLLSCSHRPEAHIKRTVVSQPPVNQCDGCVCWQVGHSEAGWFSLQGREQNRAHRPPAGQQLCYWNLNLIQADSIISFPWERMCVFTKIIA